MKGKYRKDFTGTCTFKQKGINNMRECGMLLPIASLPSKYGIGCFSKEAYKFVDQLKEAGQSFWQILPLGPTGFGIRLIRHFLLLQEILILSIWSSWSEKVFLQKMSVKRLILVMMTGILLTIKYTKRGLRY